MMALVTLAKAREERRRARKAKTFRRRVIASTVVVVVVVALVLFNQFGRPSPSSSPSPNPEPEPNKVLLRTIMGDITIQLYDDMPITTSNFKRLVKQGIYDGTIFHRVIDDESPYMIQGGDPTGTGYGDPNIPNIPDEFTDHNRNDRGTVAMANKGQPDTGSSQFFINIADNNYLDDKHPVFGEVVAGMGVVDAIGKVQTDDNDRPLEPVTIINAELVE